MNETEDLERALRASFNHAASELPHAEFARLAAVRDTGERRRQRPKGRLIAVSAAAFVVAAAVGATVIAATAHRSEVPAPTATSAPSETTSCESSPIDVLPLEAAVENDPSRQILDTQVPPGFRFTDDVRVTFAGTASLDDINSAGLNKSGSYTNPEAIYTVVVMKFRSTQDFFSMPSFSGRTPTPIEAAEPGATKYIVVRVIDQNRPKTGHTVSGRESACFRG